MKARRAVAALDEIVREHLDSELLKFWSTTKNFMAFITPLIPEALPAERPLDIRETPEFLAIAHRVREGLRAGHSYEETA